MKIYESAKGRIHNHLGLKNLEKRVLPIVDVIDENGNWFKKNYNENV